MSEAQDGPLFTEAQATMFHDIIGIMRLYMEYWREPDFAITHTLVDSARQIAGRHLTREQLDSFDDWRIDLHPATQAHHLFDVLSEECPYLFGNGGLPIEMPPGM